MYFGGQTIDEGKPHNHKEKEQSNYKEREYGETSFLAGWDTLLQRALQCHDQILHVRRDNEPLNVE